MKGLYILENEQVREAESMLEWCQISGPKKIESNTIGDIEVSTVFTSADLWAATADDKYEPLLFETMIFGGDHDLKQWQYTNIEDARKGHIKACELVMGNC